MFTFVLVIHLIICVLLVFLVLLQSGKGAQLGAAFGSMGQNTMVSPETALQKIITYMAIAFIITSILLAYFSQSGDGGSVLDDADIQKIESSVNPADDVKTGEVNAPINQNSQQSE